MPTTYAYVEFLPPTVAGVPCPDCRGSGTTGDRYELQTGGPVLLVDVFCPGCGGCGSADHLDCAGPHAWDDEADELVAGDLAGDEVCPSCLGREWNAVEAFPGVEPGTEAELLVLRVPCGCTSARARTWTLAAEQERR